MIARIGIGWRESGFENHWARVPKDGNWSLFTEAMGKACSKPDCTTFKYSDPTLTWEKDEAARYYASEWVSRSTGYEGAVRTFLVPSSIDYVLWRCRQWTELGLRGLYFDDMFLMPCRNPDTSGGSFGILEMRELVKRAAVMQHQFGQEHRLLQIHMTNALLVPSFAFATSLLTWEDHYGEELFQNRFPIDYVRAESLGTQVGCEGIVLDGIKRKTGIGMERGWREVSQTYEKPTRDSSAVRTVNVGAFRRCRGHCRAHTTAFSDLRVSDMGAGLLLCSVLGRRRAAGTSAGRCVAFVVPSRQRGVGSDRQPHGTSSRH